MQHGPANADSQFTPETVAKMKEIAGEYFLGDMIGETGSSGACKAAGYFVSDNHYLVPQKVGDHMHMDLAEAENLRENSMDYWLKWIQPRWISERISRDPRYTSIMERLYRKKAEIAEYWQKRSPAS